MKKLKCKFFICLIVFTAAFSSLSTAQETLLAKEGIYLIPYPKEVKLGGGEFPLEKEVSIVLDRNATAGDRFAAEELARHLSEQWQISATVRNAAAGNAIILTRKGAPKNKAEGYQLLAAPEKITIRGSDEAGLFYGVQTLIQLIRQRENQVYVKSMQITDWPDTRVRAMHYDTKHHQDKRSYVESLIRDLARYKSNMLVWEWEDKLAYTTHPEVGAPGAFTVREMQELTAYARKYHVQLVPLVQGLGHVSFILKWPQHAHLREIYASNFEFCPLKEDSYKLLFDLWDEAIKATPGSKYIHIGSDETYELGLCDDCRKKAAEIGKSGLYHLFVGRAAAYLQKSGRQVMVWESPMNWTQGENAAKNIQPQKGLVLAESYDHETPDFTYAKQARALGFPVFAYDPNPGIEPLFLPYFYKQDNKRGRIPGSLEDSYRFLTSTMGKGIFDGMIRTSWDDSGLPVQGWMMQFVLAAAYSWNASNPGLPEFTEAFFKNYYGVNEQDLHHLFYLLNEGAYYYSETLERNVWHFGVIGKTHLPDLPRADDLEYDPYWNKEYADQVNKAGLFLKKMDTAINIGKLNLAHNVKNAHDIELFISIAGLIRHTAQTYLDLSALEHTITAAHRQRFLSHDSTYYYMQKAEQLIQDHLARRDKLYTGLVALWEKTRLPKGMSTADKKYFFRQDRTRHYANRTPDMKYLIIDEEDLDLEGYLKRLQEYMQVYKETFMGKDGETLNDAWPVPR